jgi:hypothetical protein
LNHELVVGRQQTLREKPTPVVIGMGAA